MVPLEIAAQGNVDAGAGVHRFSASVRADSSFRLAKAPTGEAVVGGALLLTRGGLLLHTETGRLVIRNPAAEFDSDRGWRIVEEPGPAAGDLDVVGEVLDEEGTGQGIDGVGYARLVSQDLLGSQGDPR